MWRLILAEWIRSKTTVIQVKFMDWVTGLIASFNSNPWEGRISRLIQKLSVGHVHEWKVWIENVDARTPKENDKRWASGDVCKCLHPGCRVLWFIPQEPSTLNPTEVVILEKEKGE